jgi:predicted nucleotidyltransferase
MRMMDPLPAEIAKTLAARDRQAEEKRNAREAEVRSRVVTLVRAMLPESGRAWLIGSLAWGGFGLRSDVDLVLEGIKGEAAVSIELAVAQAAETEVDVIDFELLPASLRDRVLREGIAIHA